MVGPAEPNNFKGKGFPPEIGRRPEVDREIDLSERGGMLP
jgi:hypothetical protein